MDTPCLTARNFSSRIFSGRFQIEPLPIHAMSVHYEALVHRPGEVPPLIATFLGATGKIDAMQACIDPALHRALRGRFGLIAFLLGSCRFVL